MFNNFVLFTALRYFSAKKQEKFVSIISAISLVGITIGVAALIVVMSVMNGFHIELTNNIIGLNGDIRIAPISGKFIEKRQDVISRLDSYDFITNKTEIISSQALVVGQNSSGVLVKGIDLKELKNKGEITKNVISGDFAEYYGENHIAIGAELALNLGVGVGSTVKLIGPNLISTAFGSMPRAKSYKIVAIFSSGMYDYDAAVILMPLQAAQLFFSLENEINMLELKISDANDIGKYSKILDQDLSNLGVRVENWMQSNRQFLDALEIERVAMFTILSLIIIVAAFNIVSSLFMMVKDKARDIAILRTIGASKKQIMAIFIVSGSLIGLIGTFCGMLLGLIFAYNIENIRVFLEGFSDIRIFDPAIYFLYSLPSVVQMGDLVVVASLSLLLSFLATIYPAYRAASLNPVEVMRYE